MSNDNELIELRKRVAALENGLAVLVDVMSEGGGRLQALQAVVHALVVTSQGGAAMAERLAQSLEMTEANALATSMNETYLEALQTTKAACLHDAAQIQPQDDSQEFAQALSGRIASLWSGDTQPA